MNDDTDERLSPAELEALRAAERVKVQRRGRDAYERARRFEEEGVFDEALRWMERAHRLARGDDAVTFSVATLRLRRQDAAGAAPLLVSLLRRLDLREVKIALALARRQQNLPAETAHLLDGVLAGHVLDPADPSFVPIVTGAARESGRIGWCGVEPDGRLRIRLLDPRAEVTVRLDGVLLPKAVTGHGVELQASLGAAGATAARAEVSAVFAGRPVALLGATLDLAAMRALDGCVAADGEGGLLGWATFRRHPARVPSLVLADEEGRPIANLTLAADLVPDIPDRPFGLAPYGFRVPASALPPGRVRVLDETGRDQLGSPLEPGIERRAAHALARLAAGGTVAAPVPFVPIPADLVGAPPRRRRGVRPPVAIVVPVYRDEQRTLACLDSLAHTLPRGVEIHIVDDVTPEPRLAAELEARARAGRLVLHRWADGRNRGFPAAANAGIEALDGHDVVLLNSDTIVAGDWLARLARAAYAAPDIASVTPLTNEGSIFGYPRPRHPNDMPAPEAGARLDALAAAVNAGATVEVPTGNGFCMYLRADAIEAVGLLREDLFAQGYGEENDWCLRARHAGLRHLAALDVFVAHAGGASFRAGRQHLLVRNLEILNRLHPGYDALVAAHIEADPLAAGRRRLDVARLLAEPARPVVLMVTHQLGGGVERVIRERVRLATAAGSRALVLRGDPDVQRDDLLILEDGADRPRFPNLRWQVPAELDAIALFLGRLDVVRVEIHHLLGHHEDVATLCRGLGAPIEIRLHDYAWFCPRIALMGVGNTYCGEPPVETCRVCVDTLGSAMPDGSGVDAVLASSAALLPEAARIVAPTADAARRLERHFPGIAVDVEPWEARVPFGPAPARKRSPEAPLVVGVLGAIGDTKGIEVLIACARDAARRDLPLRFVVVGHTADDDRVLSAGPVFITGPYEEDEAGTLLRLHGVEVAFLPSVWPETWSYALSECWRAGLRVTAFDLGAQAERIRGTGAGELLPIGTEAPRINDALLGSRVWREASLAPERLTSHHSTEG